jgi:hypothetical protein
MSNNEHYEDNVSNFMVIPYFTGDRGRDGIERPLSQPSNPPVVPYLCSAIAVMTGGIPGPAVFMPGEDLEVAVTVANYGGGTMNAAANVAVFWSDPTTGFTKPTLLGQTPVIVPTKGGMETTPIIKGKIPVLVPKHICLLARVTAPGDYITKTTIEPANDRHWAQLNLNAITVAADQTFQFTFWAGNPFKKTEVFELVARPVNEHTVHIFAKQLGIQPTIIDNLDIQLAAIRSDYLRADQERNSARITLELKPNSRQPIHLIGKVPGRIEKESFTLVEVLQNIRGDNEAIIGSIGIIVKPEKTC